MAFWGIDPGIKGAATCLTESGAFVHCAPLPFIHGNVLDLETLMRTMERFRVRGIMVEKQSYRPGQGNVNTLMTNYGTLLALRAIFRVPFIEIWPKKWQIPMGVFAIDDSGTKRQALRVASRIWPGRKWLANDRCRTPHDGMVDSALIAEFFRLSLREMWS